MTFCRRSFPILCSATVVFSTTSFASVNYTYDARHRLTGATYDNGVTITYGYDSVGNRLSTTFTGATTTVFEDAEDGLVDGWDVFDTNPPGATIDNIYDDITGSRVIQLSGTGTSSGYRLRNNDSSDWNDTSVEIFQWSMRYSESFQIDIAVQTTAGLRYIQYTSANSDNLGTGTYIHHGLGDQVMDGTWHTFTRDLIYDLKQAQPDNDLVAILSFHIRGSGRVDNIQAYTTIPFFLDSDGDTITDHDEIYIYATHPYYADSDGDGIDDGEELIYWGTDWNSDYDNDTVINILDADSDNDGYSDGFELDQGTLPNDPSSLPSWTSLAPVYLLLLQ